MQTQNLSGIQILDMRRQFQTRLGIAIYSFVTLVALVQSMVVHPVLWDRANPPPKRHRKIHLHRRHPATFPLQQTKGTTVLEAVGLPAGNTVDTGSDNLVSVKVSLGEQEFVTRLKRPHRGKTAPWNSNFAFPVLSIGDRLLVVICDAEGDAISEIAIDIPTIFQPWFREDYVPLDPGGHIHLILNFVMTNEERKRLEFMRSAAERREFQKRKDDMLRLYDFKRKEDQCVNNGLRTIAENVREHAGQALDNWEVFSRKKGKEVASTEKEVPKKSVVSAPNQMQLLKAREERKASGQVQVPIPKDGKPRSLSSPPHNSLLEPGLLQQQAYKNPGSSTYQAQDTSRLSKAWVRVEAVSSLKLEDFSKKEETGSKIIAPQAPAFMDGWICVDCPPVPPTMAWEDALKVAQRAREAVIDANSKTSSPVTSPSEPRCGLAPAISQASREIRTSSQTLPGQAAVLSPLPPKHSPSTISNGCVKARINAFETSVFQDPDALMPKLESEKMQAKTTTARISVVAPDERKKSLEKVKKCEERERKKGQSPQDTAKGYECMDGNQDSVTKLSRQELPGDGNQDSVKKVSRQEPPRPRDGIAKDQEDQEHRLPGGCQPGKYNKQVVAGRLHEKVIRSLPQGDSRYMQTAYRLPKPYDIIVEALENPLPHKFFTEEECVSSMEDRLSQTPKVEAENLLNEINCRLVSHIQGVALMEERGVKQEGKIVVAKSDTDIEKNTLKTKVADSQETKLTLVTPEKHIEPEQSTKVKRLRNPLGGPKPTSLDKAKRSISGGSLQAWKDLQDSLEHKARKLFLLKHGLLKENFEKGHIDSDQVNSKDIDDAVFAALQQINTFMKEKFGIVLEHQQCPAILLEAGGDISNKMLQQYPLEQPTWNEATSNQTGRDVLNANNKIISRLGGSVKQVLSGVVIVVGLFVLWPRNRGNVQRYHVVKVGETLSSIAPGQCIDPSSHFCKILNPRVCEEKTIYPGQRIRLS